MPPLSISQSSCASFSCSSWLMRPSRIKSLGGKPVPTFTFLPLIDSTSIFVSETIISQHLLCMGTYSSYSILPDLSSSISFQRTFKCLRMLGSNFRLSRLHSAFSVYKGWNFGATFFGS